MTLAQVLEQRGRQQRMQQGKTISLTMLLQQRFGELPTVYVQ